ncbi:hypothetical protein Nepgr_014528 [Nepenthes gracilis]|uniref:Aluminum-activated malate transporter n=1 Tax=Nepenthes gracilis TaxID=150966 RepID=A0AAD3XPK5_NEPGR|nr:hypothetical protein Nepgr_014528 [Nepenthes gracilis]
MANLAAWEPGHCRFRFRHPWQQYLKIGTLTRQCAYRVDALNSCLNSTVEASQAAKHITQSACMKLSSETGKALKELSVGMKKMRRSPSANAHIDLSKAAAQELKSLLGSAFWGDLNLLEVLPCATVASLLIDIATCAENIAEAVHELASLADFKSADGVVTSEKPPAEELPAKLQVTDVNDQSRPEHAVVVIS